jgi:hypothetical protein
VVRSFSLAAINLAEPDTSPLFFVVHLCCCASCATKVTKVCPVCNKKISRMTKLQ